MVLNGTMLGLYEANLAFHRRLLILGGNLELVDLITKIRQRTSSAPVSQWRTRARVEQSSREHHLMIGAIEAGDAEGLKGVVRQHILQGETRLAVGSASFRSMRQAWFQHFFWQCPRVQAFNSAIT